MAHHARALPSASLQWNEIHEKLGETTIGQISKTKAARITQPHGKTKLHDKFDNMETSKGIMIQMNIYKEYISKE